MKKTISMIIAIAMLVTMLPVGLTGVFAAETEAAVDENLVIDLDFSNYDPTSTDVSKGIVNKGDANYSATTLHVLGTPELGTIKYGDGEDDVTTYLTFATDKDGSIGTVNPSDAFDHTDRAIVLKGNSQAVELAKQDNITISLWVRRDESAYNKDGSINYPIVAFGNGADDATQYLSNLAFAFENTGSALSVSDYKPDGTKYHRDLNYNTLRAGWVNYVFTRFWTQEEGATEGKWRYEIYRNGISYVTGGWGGEMIAANNRYADIGNARVFSIGAWGNSASGPNPSFAGDIASVKVYKDRRTADEVAADYNAEKYKFECEPLIDLDFSGYNPAFENASKGIVNRGNANYTAGKRRRSGTDSGYAGIIVNGTPTVGTDGEVKYLSFADDTAILTTAAAEATDSPHYISRDEISFSTWVRLNEDEVNKEYTGESATDSTYLLSTGWQPANASDDIAVKVDVEAGGEAGLKLSSTSGSAIASKVDLGTKDSKWAHFVFIRKWVLDEGGTTGKWITETYRNGEKVDALGSESESIAIANQYSGAGNNWAVVRLGNGGAYTSGFTGDVASFKVYGEAMTQEQIMADFNEFSDKLETSNEEDEEKPEIVTPADENLVIDLDFSGYDPTSESVSKGVVNKGNANYSATRLSVLGAPERGTIKYGDGANDVTTYLTFATDKNGSTGAVNPGDAFDHTDRAIVLKGNSHGSIAYEDNVTISLWVRRDESAYNKDTDKNYPIVTFGNGADTDTQYLSNVAFALQNSGKRFFITNNNATATPDFNKLTIATHTPRAGWVNYVITKTWTYTAGTDTPDDTSDDKGQWRYSIWCNGAEFAAGGQGGSVIDAAKRYTDLGSPTVFSIGAWGNSASGPNPSFAGDIASVKVYKDLRTAEEIAADYNAEKHKFESEPLINLDFSGYNPAFANASKGIVNKGNANYTAGQKTSNAVPDGFAGIIVNGTPTLGTEGDVKYLTFAQVDGEGNYTNQDAAVVATTDGTDHFISKNEISFSTWVRLNEAEVNKTYSDTPAKDSTYILSTGWRPDSASDDFTVKVDVEAGSEAGLKLSSASGSAISSKTDADENDSKWTHFVFIRKWVLDEGGATGKWITEGYRDGEKVDALGGESESIAIADQHSGAGNNWTTIRLGNGGGKLAGSNAPLGKAFAGDVASFKVYGEALTQAQIMADYSEMSAKLGKGAFLNNIIFKDENDVEIGTSGNLLTTVTAVSVSADIVGWAETYLPIAYIAVYKEDRLVSVARATVNQDLSISGTISGLKAGDINAATIFVWDASGNIKPIIPAEQCL